MAGKTLAVPRGFKVQEQLARQYPDIKLMLFDSDEQALEALEAVATGQADTYIGNLTVASHIIHDRGLSDLRVVAPSPFGDHVLAMGNRKDWPELTSIIDKVLASITEEEKTAIRNKYLDGWFRYVNPAWEKVTGYSESELLARPVLDFVHPQDHPKQQQELEALAAGHPTIRFENRYVCKDGGIRMTDGSIVWYGYQGDISRRKRQEQRLQDHQQRLKSMAAQLTLAEERERRCIAADLHDHVGQSLALTRLQLAAARKGLPADGSLNAQLGDISASLLRAIQDTRHLIFELSSPALNELGLGSAIADWCEQRAGGHQGLRVEVHDHAKQMEIDTDLRAILFRNIRELITNVIKHAGAGSLSVLLDQEGSELVTTVQDDGVGFDPGDGLQGVSSGGGFGLFSIQERMTDLGGRLELVSQPGAGCRAILRLPIPTKNAEIGA